MKSEHRIRLRGLWELYWVGAAADSVRKVRLPMDFGELFEGRSGTVQLARRFHRPTNLEPEDEVALVVENLPKARNVTLNGQAVATGVRRTLACGLLSHRF